MNVIKAQRGMLAHCAGILQSPCSIPSQRALNIVQPQMIAPLCQLHSSNVLGCQRNHRSVTSQSKSRFVVACATDSTECETVELEIKVEGMKCGGCSSRVEKALKALDHVKSVQVDLDSKLATVEVESASLIDAMNMLPSFVTTVKELGFEAEPHIEYQL